MKHFIQPEGKGTIILLEMAIPEKVGYGGSLAIAVTQLIEHMWQGSNRAFYMLMSASS